jgi:phenylalanyl-tRNA synthetase beta chain
MKISLNWLRRYLDINMPVDSIVKGLTDLGIEVESVENQAEKLRNFVIGKVIERKKHPNADKLSVCKVDAGTGEILNIVCGAPNVDLGQTVCVALVGAVVPNGGFEIKKAKLRGEVSEGMICSAKELNLGDDHTGIMVLDTKLPIGTPFAEYLGQSDAIIEISITPNRGDLLSHLGIARELGALVKKTAVDPEVKYDASGKEIASKINVEIVDTKGCLRYCGAMVEGVTVRESPEWLKNFLTSIDLRPINNIVDATNFVMMECGQPLHAFDYDRIGGKKIIIKDAKGIKKFTTLDGKERELRNDILLICDGEKPVALAGVMGGANSEISESTKIVFIESAYFDPVLTRRTSKYLGLQTDSSYRFERGIDIDRTEWACKRAAELIAELSGGKVVPGFVDEYPARLEKVKVGLRISHLNKIAGSDFSEEKVKELLGSIDIVYSGNKDNSLIFEIPQARREDLYREIDLIEEVIRLNGYEAITEPDHDNIYLDVRDFAGRDYDTALNYENYLVSRGFKESITNSLIDEDDAKLFTENYVTLLNPSGKAMSVLRPNLMIGALHTIRHNFHHGAQSLKMYETGNVFSYDDTVNGGAKRILENRSKLLINAGNCDLDFHSEKEREFDIYDMKGELEMLFGKFNIEINKLNDYYYGDYFDCRIEYFNNDVLIASIVKFSKGFLKKFDIERSVIVCEIY